MVFSVCTGDSGAREKNRVDRPSNSLVSSNMYRKVMDRVVTYGDNVWRYQGYDRNGNFINHWKREDSSGINGVDVSEKVISSSKSKK